MSSLKKPKLVIFDIDGTLLNTEEGLVFSIMAALKKNGLTLPEDVNIKTFIGPPIQNSFRKTFPSLSDQQIAGLALDFRNDYKTSGLFKAFVYPGLEEVIQKLVTAGNKIAVATYKREDYAYSIVDHFGITKYTHNIHGSDFAGKLKKADIIKLCAAESGIPLLDCIMVGDSDNDSDGAIAAGTAFIPVTYGFGFTSKTDFCKIPHLGVANKPEDLLKII
jgi:phosphoglycolate phosphatase